MTDNRSKLNLTEGKLVPTLFGFAVPVILGALLQTVFNIADQLVLGQMAGSVAVAAVGATTTITHLIINLFVGSSTGVTVLLAQMLGAKRQEDAKRLVSTALIFSAVGGAVWTVIAIPLIGPLLALTKCPDTCFDGAKTYLLIYFCSIPFNLIYNYGASILRTAGDSRRPTVYLTVSGVVNAALNVILCLLLENKVAAVAIATGTSYAIAALLAVRRLIVTNESFRFEWNKPIFDWKLFGQILRYGLPNGLTSATYPLANLQVQAAINSFGHSATAGFSAAYYTEMVISAFATGFGGAAGAVMGHSIGAEKKKRVGQSFWISFGVLTAVSILLGAIFYWLGVPILSLFLPDDPTAVEYGMIKMLYVTLPHFIAGINSLLCHGINSFGKTLFTMISNLTTVVVFRVIWMNLIYPLCPTLGVVCQCFLVSWMLTTVLYTVAFAATMIRFKQGKIKRLVK